MATQTAKTNDEAQIRQLLDNWVNALRAKDIDGLMTHYAPDMLLFDLAPPLQYKGADAYRKSWEEWLPTFQGPVGYEIRDLSISRRRRLLPQSQSNQRNASQWGEDRYLVHLQAGIAACHCAAQNYESTDWARILSLYDRLVQLDDSPVVGLNRAVAVANVHGPSAGIEALEAIHNREELNSYHLLYVILGELEARLGKPAAIKNFCKALELATMQSERTFISKKIADIGSVTLSTTRKELDR
jgi:SnoaL-like protein